MAGGCKREGLQYIYMWGGGFDPWGASFVRVYCAIIFYNVADSSIFYKFLRPAIRTCII